MLILVIGGAGAGKSTVLDVMEGKCGFRVERMDELAKGLYHRGTAVFDALCCLLGEGIVSKDGESLLLPAIAERIYHDNALREQVEGIVHPAVRQRVAEIFSECRQAGIDLAMETALPEMSFCASCDEVWYVHTEREVRIQRMMESRGYSRERAENTIRAQRTDEEYRDMADLVIDNSGEAKKTADEVYEHCKRLQRERDIYWDGQNASSGGCGRPHEGGQ